MIAKGSLYVMGGRAGDIKKYVDNAMLNDVWVWDMGVAELQAPNSATNGTMETVANGWRRMSSGAEWSPRAGMAVVYSEVEDQLIMVGGEEVVAPTPSASPRAVADKVAAAAAEMPLGEDVVRACDCDCDGDGGDCDR